MATREGNLPAPVADRKRRLTQSVLRAEIVDHCWQAQYSWDLLTARVAALRAYLMGGPAPAGLEALNDTTARRVSPGDPAMQQMILMKLVLWEPISVILESCAIVGRTIFPSGGERCIYCGRTTVNSTGFQQARVDLILEGLARPTLPNLSSHKARNVLAHVEDRVMAWVGKQLEADPGARLNGWMWGSGPPEGPTFRYLNFDTWEFQAGGEVCNLKNLVDETRVVSELLPSRQGIETLRRDPSSAC